jgi:thermostable 8-oxoguanine DNA glycosylase
MKIVDKHYKIEGIVAINDFVKTNFSIGKVEYIKRCTSFIKVVLTIVNKGLYKAKKRRVLVKNVMGMDCCVSSFRKSTNSSYRAVSASLYLWSQ